MASSPSCAVRIARRSTEVCTTSGSRPRSASSLPPRIASSSPWAVRSTSTQPVKRFFAFHALSPWRSSTRRYESAMGRAYRVGLRRLCGRSSGETGRDRRCSVAGGCRRGRGRGRCVRPQPFERGQVPGRFAALEPPLPLAPDGAGESELEQGVEAGVRGVEHGAEQLVDGVFGDRGERYPPDQVDVAEAVDRERDAGQAGVAFEQPAVDRLVVLVRVPHDEGVYGKGVVSDKQRAGGAELVGARKRDDVMPLGRPLVL